MKRTSKWSIRLVCPLCGWPQNLVEKGCFDGRELRCGCCGEGLVLARERDDDGIARRWTMSDAVRKGY